ncbi:E3 ubiquitin-protein ligase TRIM21-like [Centropristis striata]|uniref:E3 ubiquitin-protein ligase TRIM21-like n=1 Tax=Centropristis striata TaxID=184440 RepID=UPI0027DFCA0E|nr:E3 ubiquitin-protein ligase TRIM21-like [Centropristis striata]
MFGSIVGLNRLRSGKSYWEVEVRSKTGWDLGVARGDANRKGKLALNPDNGYWVTVHYEDKRYAALTSPPVSLRLKRKPQKVGVFVDYEEGLVSFYDVTAQSHIYSFTECSFGGEVFPYFSPHLKRNETNAPPLIISAVKTQ